MAGSGSAAQDVQDAILPLTVPDHSIDGVTAERIVTLDLSAAETTGDARVTDQYILTNAAGEAVTLPLAYPVANASPDTPPTLLLDGEPVPADVSADGTLLWTSADATIPAGGSVTEVEAKLSQTAASFLSKHVTM